MLNFFCLMFRGNVLTDEMCNYLLRIAAFMIKKGKASQTIKTDEIEGKIRTDFKYAILGSICGIVFFAEVESDGGRSDVEYIVRPVGIEGMDLDKEGTWVSFNLQAYLEAHNN